MKIMLKRMISRNVRHKMAEMFASQWTGALDAAMNEIIIDCIEQAEDQLEAEDERKEK